MEVLWHCHGDCHWGVLETCCVARLLLSSSELIFKRFLNISQSLQRDRGVIMSISVLMSDFLRLVSLLCSVEVKLCPSGVNLLQTSINYEMIWYKLWTSRSHQINTRSYLHHGSGPHWILSPSEIGSIWLFECEGYMIVINNFPACYVLLMLTYFSLVAAGISLPALVPLSLTPAWHLPSLEIVTAPLRYWATTDRQRNPEKTTDNTTSH